MKLSQFKFKLPEEYIAKYPCSYMYDEEGNIVLKEDLILPHDENDEIGEIQIRLKNDLIFSQKLFTINIGKTKEESPLKKIIRAF